MRTVVLIAMAALAAPALAQVDPGPAQGGSVTFVVGHVRDAAGHVRVDICTADTFLKAECPYSGAAPATLGSTTVTVQNVPPGTYAAQIYHDRNDNHRVDRNPLGVPTEEIGFSRDAPVGLHGPRFSRAAFDHGRDDQTLDVRLRRFP